VQNGIKPRVLIIVEEERTRVYVEGDVVVRIEEAGPGIQERWWAKWLPWTWCRVKEDGCEHIGYVDHRSVSERIDEATRWAIADACCVAVDLVNEEVRDG